MTKYQFRSYSSLLPGLFELERQRLVAALGSHVVIEHVGSTAVPNLGGKGIIDIAIATDDFERLRKPLETLDYVFRPDWSTPSRLYFKRELEDNKQWVHIHVMHLGSADFERMLLFRDYLRKHPEEAKRYAELKKTILKNPGVDGVQYRQAKEPLILEFLRKARD